MKKIIVLIITLVTSTLMAFSQNRAIPGPYQWEKRILLVFSPENASNQQEQLAIFERQQAAMTERDLVFFLIEKAGVIHPEGNFYGENAAHQLREQYKVAADDFVVILIGKDGTEKLRQHEVLSTEKLFARIDSMPMRKQEMRKNGGN